LLTVLFNVAQEQLLLLIEDVFLTEAFFFTFLNLIDNFASTFTSRDLALNLTILLRLDILEAFDLHHDVEMFLLANPLAFEVLILLNLFVTNSEYFRVHHQCVETFNVIFILVELLLSLLEHC